MGTEVTKYEYVAKKPDQYGELSFSITENQTWAKLYDRQIMDIQNFAYEEYLEGLRLLELNNMGVPSLRTVNDVLLENTGWTLEPVECIISFDRFFYLLANKKFPAAAFIRRLEDIDFVPVPDIFHEIFGHCPLLVNKEYADFSQRIGRLGVRLSKKKQKYLARLYWFTVETGLIENDGQLKVYGGSTLSSYSEYTYATTSDLPLRLPFNLLNILRTPYRVDVLPAVYFNISTFKQLDCLDDEVILSNIEKALDLGDFRSLYPPREIQEAS